MPDTQAAKTVTWRSLVVLLAVTLGAAGLSTFLTRGSMDVYDTLSLPVYAPPGWLFPVAWSLLYPAMAVAAWLYLRQERNNALSALALYFVQLLVNVIWPLLFFLQKAWGLSFVWLVLLLALASLTGWRFYQRSKAAGVLFLPYLCWLSFAAVLNFAIARMN